jgi:hypothetical protein
MDSCGFFTIFLSYILMNANLLNVNLRKWVELSYINTLFVPDCTAPFWVRVRTDAMADAGDGSQKNNRGKTSLVCLSACASFCPFVHHRVKPHKVSLDLASSCLCLKIVSVTDTSTYYGPESIATIKNLRHRLRHLLSYSHNPS